jgi:hypothetical protein
MDSDSIFFYKRVQLSRRYEYAGRPQVLFLVVLFFSIYSISLVMSAETGQEPFVLQHSD